MGTGWGTEGPQRWEEQGAVPSVPVKLSVQNAAPAPHGREPQPAIPAPGHKRGRVGLSAAGGRGVLACTVSLSGASREILPTVCHARDLHSWNGVWPARRNSVWKRETLGRQMDRLKRQTVVDGAMGGGRVYRCVQTGVR